MKGFGYMNLDDLRNYNVADFEGQMFFKKKPQRIVNLFIEECFCDHRIKEFLIDLIYSQLKFIEKYDDRTKINLTNSERGLESLLDNLKGNESITYKTWVECKLNIQIAYNYKIEQATNLFDLYTLFEIIKKQDIKNKLNENKQTIDS